MAYKKLTDDIYIEEVLSPNTISLKSLEEELENLIEFSQKDLKDEELIEWAKENHPAFLESKLRISELETLIKELKSL